MLHVAASLVVAFEQLKEGPIMEAFTKWKKYYTLAAEDADFKPKLQSEEQLREQWERTFMIQVSRLLQLGFQCSIVLLPPTGQQNALAVISSFPQWQILYTMQHEPCYLSTSTPCKLSVGLVLKSCSSPLQSEVGCSL